MINRVILLILLLPLFLNFTGCWDPIELDERIIISGVGIDKAPDTGNYQLTFQSIIPGKMGTPLKPGSEDKRSVHVYTAEAGSLVDAFRLYCLKVNGTPYFAQNRLIVIGSNAAKEGVMPLLDFFRRYPENNIRIYVLITEGKAADILNWESESVRIPTDHIVSLIRSSNYISNNVTEDLHEFVMKLLGKTTSPSTARIEIVQNMNSKPSDIDISGTSVFKKDKLSGYLNDHETRGLAWILDEYGHGTVEAHNMGEQNTTLTEMVLRSKTKITPELTGGMIKMKIDIKEEGMIIMQPGETDIASQKPIELLEKKLSEGIKNDIEACMKKVQKEYQTDVFGFGEAIHRKYPSQWKVMEEKWDVIFPEITVEINTEVKIRGFGSITGKE